MISLPRGAFSDFCQIVLNGRSSKSRIKRDKRSLLSRVDYAGLAVSLAMLLIGVLGMASITALVAAISIGQAEATVIIAHDIAAVSQPPQFLGKLRETAVAERIFITDSAPHIQCLAPTVANVVYLIVGNETI